MSDSDDDWPEDELNGGVSKKTWLSATAGPWPAGSPAHVVLGVKEDRYRGLTSRQVDEAYRRLSLQHHPDRGGSTLALQRLTLARIC